MIGYIYDHYEPFKHLICRSGGTPYEKFIHNMAEVEAAYAFRYIDVLKNQGRDMPKIDKELCHMIAFDGMFVVVRHDMPRDRAKRFIAQLREFYTAAQLPPTFGRDNRAVKPNYF